MTGANLIAAAIDRAVASANGPSLLTWSNVLLSVASLVASGFSGYIARRALLVSREQSEALRASIDVSKKAIDEQLGSERASRNLEALLHCQNGYKMIESERLNYRYSNALAKMRITAGQIGSMFRNYWTLKSDQLDYWLDGHVDYDTFLTWNVSTLRHFMKSNNEEKFFVKSFLVGWAHYGRPYHVDINPLFVRFTDALQYTFRSRRDIEEKDVIIVLNMIEELDKINIQIGKNGRPSRRYGAPESLEQFRDDLNELHNNKKDLLGAYLPKGYDIKRYGNELKRENPL